MSCKTKQSMPFFSFIIGEHYFLVWNTQLTPAVYLSSNRPCLEFEEGIIVASTRTIDKTKYPIILTAAALLGTIW